MNTSITREAALRVGLAAMELNVSVRELTTAIVDKLELPLTEDKLAGFSVEDLRIALYGEDSIYVEHKESLKRAVRLLWGESVAFSELPVREPYQDGDMPGSVRLACASNTDEMLDGHFGSCERFLIYQVSASEVRLVDVRSTLEAEHAEDKNAARTALIQDCHVVYVQSIGGPAAAKVVRSYIHPVKIAQACAARAAAERLRQSLMSPPPWLARIMGVASPSLTRIAAMESEA